MAAKSSSRLPPGLLEPFWASLPPKPVSLELWLTQLGAKSEGLRPQKNKLKEEAGFGILLDSSFQIWGILAKSLLVSVSQVVN